MAQVQLRRLSRSDYEGLVVAHDKLVTVTSLLNRSSWAQAPAVVALIGDVDRFIAELYNKTEASLLRALGQPIPASPGSGSPEISPAAGAIDVDPKGSADGET